MFFVQISFFSDLLWTYGNRLSLLDKFNKFDNGTLLKSLYIGVDVGSVHVFVLLMYLLNNYTNYIPMIVHIACLYHIVIRYAFICSIKCGVVNKFVRVTLNVLFIPCFHFNGQFLCTRTNSLIIFHTMKLLGTKTSHLFKSFNYYRQCNLQFDFPKDLSKLGNKSRYHKL